MSMFFSASTGGFYDRAIHGDQMPADVVQITRQRYESLFADQSAGRLITADEAGNPISVDRPVLDAGVPNEVTMRQARLALLHAGKLQAVSTAIAQLPSPQREAAQIEWEFASTVHRESQVVQMLASLLPLSAAELDQFFIEAAAL